MAKFAVTLEDKRGVQRIVYPQARCWSQAEAKVKERLSRQTTTTYEIVSCRRVSGAER